MSVKINALIAVVCMALSMSACTTMRTTVGGNVGALTDDEQSVIALDLFKSVQDDFDRSVPVAMRQTTHGETVFIMKLREVGIAVSLVDSNPDVRLDFYYFGDRGEYAGVVTVSNKRIVRRYAVENNTLILLGTSVAWPGISRE